MNFGELKEALGDLMARTDYTDVKRGQHINWAIQRIQRVANLPMMERTVEDFTDLNGAISIPYDLITLRSFYITDTNCHLEKIDLNRIRQALDRSPPPGECLRYFYRSGNFYYIVGAQDGVDVTLIYYGAWEPLTLNFESNEITLKAPEAVIYCAASYACTYFMDSRVQEMEERYQSLAEDLKLQQWNEEIATSSSQTIEPLTAPEAYPGGW